MNYHTVSYESWIPAFAGMTTHGKPRGIKPNEIKRGMDCGKNEII
jgi:hypothetical protein